MPFAAVGGIFALPLAGLNLSVSALVGFMALFGIAMLNGVILVERIRQLRFGGQPMTRGDLRRRAFPGAARGDDGVDGGAGVAADGSCRRLWARRLRGPLPW